MQTQLAAELCRRVSDESVRKAILEMPYFQVGGQFSNDRYLQVIRQMNFQPDAFREYLREDMTRSQLVGAVAGTDFILENELNNSVALQQQTRSIEYLVVTKESLQAGIEVTEQEIADYYELNQPQFLAPEQVSVSYIDLNAASLTLDSSVSEEDIKAYYDQNSAQYVEPEKRRVSHILIDNSEDDDAAKAKAEELLTQLQNGADFAELAESSSDDVVSAEMGGDLDWIERDMMDPAFEDATYALENKGDISDVVESEFGYHIIKLTDIQTQQVKPYADVKDELRAELERTKKINAFYEKQTQMGELAFEISDTLIDAAEAAGVEVQKTELVTRNALPEPLNNPQVVTAIFSPEVLEDRMNSEVIEVGDKHAVVVRVNDHKAATTKALADVSEQIKATLVSQKASELAKEKARTLYAEIEAGKSLNEVAQAEGLTVRQEAALARQAYTVSPAIVQQAFKMAHPQGAPEVEVVDLNNGDAAIVALKAVNPATEVEINEQQKQNITMAQVNKNYMVFIAALKAQAEVQVPKATQAAE